MSRTSATPVVSWKGPTAKEVDVQVRSDPSSLPGIERPPLISSATAVNTLSVPSVTMNGGRFTFATSRPLSRPAPAPTASPIARADRGRHPERAR